MRLIKDLCDDIRENIREARDKIDRAYALRDECKAAAEWYRSMAEAHLNFNAAGHEAVTRAIEDYKKKGQHSLLEPGMMAVYDVIHADLVQETNEVRWMIEQFK